jgi:uncharacterized protein
MLSLTKIITLVGLLAIVWFAFRLLGKVQRERQAALRRNGGDGAKTPRGSERKAGDRKAPTTDTQEMAKCAVCGVYVAADAARCGTPGCPR